MCRPSGSRAYLRGRRKTAAELSRESEASQSVLRPGLLTQIGSGLLMDRRKHRPAGTIRIMRVGEV